MRQKAVSQVHAFRKNINQTKFWFTIFSFDKKANIKFCKANNNLIKVRTHQKQGAYSKNNMITRCLYTKFKRH